MSSEVFFKNITSLWKRKASVHVCYVTKIGMGKNPEKRRLTFEAERFTYRNSFLKRCWIVKVITNGLKLSGPFFMKYLKCSRFTFISLELSMLEIELNVWIFLQK